jgi:class 3 adenylate cyclase
MTAARRLAAILAADVAGHSRLMGADKAGTAKAVREHCEAQDVPDTLALRCLSKTHM